MRRRDYLAAVAGVGGLGAGAWYVFGTGGSDRVSTVQIETLDARGSDAGKMRVPVPGSVTVLDVFSIGCAPCKTELRRLNDIRGKLGENVRLVSVTNDAIGGTLTREDIRRWWRENGGNWSVGLDDGGKLMRELNVTGLPTLAVVDADGALAWSHAGIVEDGKLLDVVDGLKKR
ncbi:MAG: TlpA family protein disulfide reductase [Salinigranum sp.]